MHQGSIKTYILVILTSFFISSCSSPSMVFKDSDLLIDQSVMPANWSKVESGDSVEDEGQNSGAYIMFQFEGTTNWDRGGEKVYRYSNSMLASWHYKRFEGDYFNDSSVYRTSPWQIPDGFEFSSSAAKQWHFACAGSNFGIPDSQKPSELCGYLAQYDEFLVYFPITREVNGTSTITIDQITSIVKAIDKRMNDYLKP